MLPIAGNGREAEYRSWRGRVCAREGGGAARLHPMLLPLLRIGLASFDATSETRDF